MVLLGSFLPPRDPPEAPDSPNLLRAGGLLPLLGQAEGKEVADPGLELQHAREHHGQGVEAVTGGSQGPASSFSVGSLHHHHFYYHYHYHEDVAYNDDVRSGLSSSVTRGELPSSY